MSERSICGASFGNIKISDLDFTDDAVIFAETLDIFWGALDAMNEESEPLEEEEIGTILCAECWCCLSSLLGYWAQSWMGRHSDTVYQHAGTHFADLGTMTGRVNPTWY